MHRKETRIILAIILFIFGIVIALQVKSTLYAKTLSSSAALSAEKLTTQIMSEQKQVDELRAAMDENLTRREDLIKTYVNEQNDYQLSNDLESVDLVAGLVDVKGPGITVKLDDAPARQPDMPVKWQIIHDLDIKIILNELKEAGAQAISINGERVMPMSEQVCAGPTILINGNRYPTPYIINVIGDPGTLYESMSMSTQIAEMMQFKIRVEITKSDEILIPKYSGVANIDMHISGLEGAGK